MLEDPKHFTDREAALAAYDALWLPGAPRRVLNITGLSGNGKSTLLWYIANYHDSGRRLRFHFDFVNQTLRIGDHDLLDKLADNFEPHLPAGALAAYYSR